MRYKSIGEFSFSHIFPIFTESKTRKKMAKFVPRNCLGLGFVNFVCPEDPNEAMFRCHSYRNSCAPWAVPDTAILPLAYWIGCTSITGGVHPHVVTKIGANLT
jgi:hypothetical protein